MEIFMTVTKETIIGDIIEYDMDASQFFAELGMHCLGCPASMAESVGEACEIHGADSNWLITKLNEYFAGKNSN
jgi:hybrid cluster-associated redox disulfide protein